jgi:hypothetical protein
LQHQPQSGPSVGALVSNLKVGVALAKSDESFAQELLRLSDEEANWFSIWHDPTQGSRGPLKKFSRKTAHRSGFVVVHLKDGVQLGDLQKIFDPFAQV